MGGRGEDRLVEKIFPIAGELLLADNHRFSEGLRPRAGGYWYGVAELGLARAAEFERRAFEIAQRLDEAKSGLRIDGKRVGGGDTACGVGEPDVLRLRDRMSRSSAPDRSRE